jgi:hypothetical protein
MIKLNSTVLKKVNGLVYHPNTKKYSPKFYSKTPYVVIQTVKKVDTGDMLFFGCFFSK